MTVHLWQKKEHKIDPDIMKFMAGDDIILDRQIFIYDIQATRAHVQGLEKIGIINASECQAIETELSKLADAFETGKFVLTEQFEDGHTAIEFWLTHSLGTIGKKVHTGRSRNDQVLVACRLLQKNNLSEMLSLCHQIAHDCLEQASITEKIPIPGYTHMQQAVVSSVGLWFASFAESFIDNIRVGQHCLEIIDCNPLGTAAGYGVNIALDRNHTTQALNFSRMQINPIYAQNSRGKFELHLLSALSQCLLDVRRIAWDLSLFTTQEFAFIRLDDPFTTGSSIMPNKRNPDVIELLRASYPKVQAAITEIQSLLSLPSGYQRDLQNTKAAYLHAMNHGLAALRITAVLIPSLKFSTETIHKCASKELYATDLALKRVNLEGIPFREAYASIMDNDAIFKNLDPIRSIEERISPGGCGNLCLDQLRSRLESMVSPA